MRWPIVVHLVTLLRARPGLAAVQVESGWPGDQIQAETVYVADVDGDVTYPLLQADRLPVDDKFRITLQVRVSNRADLDATGARVDEILREVVSALQDDASLDDFSDVIDAEATYSGPLTGRTPQGVVGFGAVVVTVHARLA